MAILSILRDTATNASIMSIVRVVTNDILENIVQPGWIKTQQILSYDSDPAEFQFRVDDVILIRLVDNTFTPYGTAWFWITPDFSSLIPITSIYPNQQGITAHAGGGQTGATLTNPGINVVTTVVTANDSVILPLDVQDVSVIIANRSSHTLAVFPQPGDNISTLAVNQSILISSGVTRLFIGTSATNWSVFD
jgi:hypothetical protein